VLQDVHWSHGSLGYFPDYLLGSIFASQLWDEMQKDIPDATAQIEKGKYDKILGWQREKIHQHGGKFTFPELVERITGGLLKWEPYMTYLQAKFGEIYGL
jgi:carboxypeptidase Taq